MLGILSNVLSGLLGFAAGIFTVLSFLEKPAWRLMWRPRSARVADDVARTVHRDLNRLIHYLPPTMIATMSTTAFLLSVQVYAAGFSERALVVAGIFFLQMGVIASQLLRRIRDVEGVSSDGSIAQVRDGLGALALLHHQGLLAATTTLVAQWMLMGV